MRDAYYSACMILHNICVYSGDDGRWLGEAMLEEGQQQQQEQQRQEEAGMAAGAPEAGAPEAGAPEQEAGTAAQRRAGFARRQELVRLFRR